MTITTLSGRGIRTSRPPICRWACAHMMLTRAFDDRMQRMQRQGRMSFYMKSTGEEAVAVAAGMALRPGDMLFPSYRNQGLYVVRGRSLTDLMCQCLSNTNDMCKGRQMPVMYHWAQGNIFLDFRKSRYAVSRRPPAGPWRRRSRARTTLRPVGSVRARRPKPIFTTH